MDERQEIAPRKRRRVGQGGVKSPTPGSNQPRKYSNSASRFSMTPTAHLQAQNPSDVDKLIKVQLSKPPRVIDPVNVKHLPRLPIKTRRDFVHKLHELLRANATAAAAATANTTAMVESTLRVDSVKVVSTTEPCVPQCAATVEHAIFKANKTPNNYRNHCIRLAKQLVSETARGVRFDLKRFMEPESRSDQTSNPRKNDQHKPIKKMTSSTQNSRHRATVAESIVTGPKRWHGSIKSTTLTCDPGSVELEETQMQIELDDGLKFIKMHHCRACLVDNAEVPVCMFPFSHIDLP